MRYLDLLIYFSVQIVLEIAINFITTLSNNDNFTMFCFNLNLSRWGEGGKTPSIEKNTNYNFKFP